MLNTGILFLVLSVGMVAGTGCSVKEDRADCPCYLNVSFKDSDRVGDIVGLLGWKELQEFRESVDVSSVEGYWVKPVHRGQLILSVFSGLANAGNESHYAVIPLGSQCDSLYAFHEGVDASGEQAFAEVSLHKQFCTVHLDIMKSAAQMQDYRFVIEGNTCGFDLLDFSPVAGAFRFEPKAAIGERVMSFRIPRQVDDSLELGIWFKDGTGYMENAGTFPLGKYIVRQGYNWDAVDLQDIYVKIDVVISRVVISVDGWEDGMVFELIEQ